MSEKRAGTDPSNTTDRGPWSETYHRKKFFVLDPKPEEIHLRDIAHHLAHQCRFGGAVHAFYSVAQHSCLVHDNLPDELKLAGLMHDAHEAYIVDVPSPVKWAMKQLFREVKATAEVTSIAHLEDPYTVIERRIWRAIAKRFDLPEFLPEEVKTADMRALFTERRDLREAATALWEGEDVYKPFPEIIKPWAPEKAEMEFLGRYLEDDMRRRGVETRAR